MKRMLLSAALLVAALGLSWHAYAQEVVQTHHHHVGPPACPPGCNVIEEVILQDVCKYLTTPKKKWVYSCVDDPFCIPNCHGLCQSGCLNFKHTGGSDCQDCGDRCTGPYCRIQLVKKQIDCGCVTKCVIEKVPVVVYRIVPCGSVPPGAKVVGSSPTPTVIPGQKMPSIEELKTFPKK